MKKFLSFMFSGLMLFVVSPVMGNEQSKLAKKCFEWYEAGQTYLYVFFNNGESIFPTIGGQSCKEAVTDVIKNRLEGKTNKNMSISLVGMASSAGTGTYDNAGLSDARKKTVEGVIKNLEWSVDLGVSGGDVNANILKNDPHTESDRAVVVIFSAIDQGITDTQRNLIKEKYSVLMGYGLFEKERSVWKDKDGNFNTARLASDSIAGVVLGTAGGLISSHVIKKSQVKKGFEDIQCVIAGQPVAEWGDLFQVGIQ